MWRKGQILAVAIGIAALVLTTPGAVTAKPDNSYRLAYSARLSVEIFALQEGSRWCRQYMSLRIEAKDPAFYDKESYRSLMSKLGPILVRECPKVTNATVSGYAVDGKELLYQGTVSAKDNWALVDEKPALDLDQLKEVVQASPKLAPNDQQRSTVSGVDSGTKTTTPTMTVSRDRETVREVQQRLTTLGYDPGPADGVYGSKTRRAIETYQRDAKLTVDGLVSPALLAHLRGAGATSASKPASAKTPSLYARKSYASKGRARFEVYGLTLYMTPDEVAKVITTNHPNAKVTAFRKTHCAMEMVGAAREPRHRTKGSCLRVISTNERVEEGITQQVRIKFTEDLPNRPGQVIATAINYLYSFGDLNANYDEFMRLAISKYGKPDFTQGQKIRYSDNRLLKWGTVRVLSSRTRAIDPQKPYLFLSRGGGFFKISLNDDETERQTVSARDKFVKARTKPTGKPKF